MHTRYRLDRRGRARRIGRVQWIGELVRDWHELTDNQRQAACRAIGVSVAVIHDDLILSFEPGTTRAQSERITQSTVAAIEFILISGIARV